MHIQIEKIENDLNLLKQWFDCLHPLQKDHIAYQVIHKLPLIEVVNYKNVRPEHFLAIFNINKDRITQGIYVEKSFLLLMIVQMAVEMLLGDYPEDLDSYLEWYPSRANLFSYIGQELIQYGYNGDPGDKDSIIKFHMESTLHAKSTWEASKRKSNYMGSGAGQW